MIVRGRFAVLWLVALGAALDAGPAADTALEEARKLRTQGAIQEAIAAYRQAVGLLREGKDTQRLAPALDELASLANAAGDYGSAREAALECASLARGLGDGALEGRALNRAGAAELFRGDYELALDHFQRALHLAQSAGDHEAAVLRRNNAGNVFLYQGRYLDALRTYQTALSDARARAGQPWQPRAAQVTLTNLATLWQRLGRDDLALHLYQSLRAESLNLPPAEEAQMLSNLGVLVRRLGDAPKAVELYHRAEELFRRERNRDSELGVRKNIAIALAFDLDQLESAERIFRQVLKEARESGNGREELQARMYLGEVLFRQDRLRPAAQTWEQTLRGAKSLGLAEEQWKAQYGLGRAAERSGDAEQALAWYQQAMDTFESVRSRLQVASLKPEFLANKREVYDAAIRLHVDRYRKGGGSEDDLAALFSLAERSRARVLQDRLQADLERAPGARPARDRLRELRRRVGDLDRRLAREPDNATLRQEIAGLENEAVRLERETLEASLPNLPAVPAAPDLKVLQRELEEDAALLEFWVGPSEAALLWATHHEVGVALLPYREPEQELLEQLARALANPESTNWRDLAARAGAWLLGPVPPLRLPGLKRLYVVPDGLLHLVPLEPLLLPDSRPVAERFAVTYLPAGSLLRTGTKEARWRAPWTVQLVGFGDPVAAGQDSRNATVFAGDERWLRLPRSVDELRAIAGELSGRSRVFLGADATRRRLEQIPLAGVSLLHFSTHAAADSEDPRRTRMLLSGSGPESRFDYLLPADILLLDLKNTDLVVLSACETERGRYVAGEGVQSLGRAFLAAGARATLASLWPVEDAATSEFMRLFYHRLARGDRLGTALAYTKRRFARLDGPWCHPHYWAGWLLTGNDAVPGRTVPWSWALAAVGLLLAAAAFIAARRSQKAVANPNR